VKGGGRAALAFGVGLASAFAACGAPSPPGATYGALGGEVARVGDVAIPASLVERVARDKGIAPKDALGDLVEDALAAEGARAASLDRAPSVAWATQDALARAVSVRAWQAAREAGPASMDELSRLTVIHAVVLRSRTVEEVRSAAAARAIAAAVPAATNAADFEARAKAVSAGLRLQVESLAPFDASGRDADGRELDLDFVAGAFAIPAVGATSGVVESRFGWHVIRLVAREPPAPADVEARRRELESAVQALRARTAWRAILHERQGRTAIDVSSAADELLARVTVTQ